MTRDELQRNIPPGVTTADKLPPPPRTRAPDTAEAEPDDAPPAPAKARPEGTLSTEFLRRGRVFTYSVPMPLSAERIDRVCDRLDELGLEPLPLPPVLGPGGERICPKHHEAMREREKQGDTWYSHKVDDGRGGESFCKGRPGKDSPGWDLP